MSHLTAIVAAVWILLAGTGVAPVQSWHTEPQSADPPMQAPNDIPSKEQSTGSKAEDLSPHFAKDSVFSPEDLSIEETRFVLDAKYADMDGDGIRDDIVLIGHKENADSIYASAIQIAVKSGSTGVYTIRSVGSFNEGYGSCLFIGRFDSESHNDILVTTATMGSGGTSTYQLVSYQNAALVDKLDEEVLNAGLPLDIRFTDEYKLTATNALTGQTDIIDARSSREDYIRLHMYDSNGKLLNTKEQGMIDGFVNLAPEDTDHDGIYELRGVQYISGAWHANVLAQAESVWAVRHGSLELLSDKLIALPPLEER
ncbi:hypothetical protein [Paenibacillus sp. UNC451MF]|uniref:hypothetical protein n=1 Tax=Paenibacillus sp. UNC451MF TaxID=1449063 RepID=UPI00048F8E78|nr:hypothetical protein [Paenibacillus sp. UNC451MF]